MRINKYSYKNYINDNNTVINVNELDINNKLLENKGIVNKADD